MWIAISNAIGSQQLVGGGAPPDPGYTPPLDTYTGATAAYSVRKLSSTYSGPCIEAYRVSDGARQNIGFDSAGLIDTAAIIAFGGVSEVRVSRWYDQSGNSNDGIEIGVTGQDRPTIYTGASILTDNGNPAIRFQRTGGSTGTGLRTPSTPWSTAGAIEFFMVFRNTGQVGDQRTWSTVAASLFTGATRFRVDTSGNSPLYYTQAKVGVQNIFVYEHNPTAQTVYIDGLQDAINPLPVGTPTSSSTGGIGIRYNGNEGHVDAFFQELIHYPVDQSSVRAALEANLNDYFQITNLPASSSGLLYDYPDAAAAYSVRQLSNNAIKCMRVKQTVPPYDELDIGFTATGDLDEQAIIDFGGANPLTVSKWYDQSGQSNHATQVTPSAQPSIYDGSAVLTENGKPFLKFRGGNGGNESLTMGSSVTCETMFSVVANDTAGFLAYYLYNSGGNLGFYSGGTFQVSANGPGVLSGATIASISGTVTGQTLLYNDHNGTGWEVGQDGGTASQVIGTTAKSINQVVRPSTNLQVEKFQECIIWDSDNSSNRTAIEYNVGDYYGIDVLPLDTYTTANAAYSFRKLRTAYAGSAVRVRRDVAPFDEQDIGFDSYGNLDLAALDTFSGGDRLRVSVWYDQTTGGWDASNVTYAKQPLIHDGTSVITLNGSPAMDYEEDVTSRSLNTANGVISATASPLWVFVVGGINAGFTTSYPKITGPSVPMGVVGTTTNFFSVWRGTQVFWGPGNGAPAGDQYIRTETATGTAMNGYLNGVLLANNKTIGTGNFSTNLQFGGGGGYSHKIQEYIIFEDNMTADRASIENMINSHYGTY